MSIFKKIAFTWLGILLAFCFSLFLPHETLTKASFVSYSLQALLLLLSAYLVRHERVGKNKFIFVNFGAFFSVSFLFHIYNFVGTLLFAQMPKARLYYFEYISAGLYFFLLAFAIGYLAIDLLFRDFKTIQKYLVALAIVGGFFTYYYYPYFSEPSFLYTTADIRDWKELDRVASSFSSSNAFPTDLELTQLVSSSANLAPTLSSLPTDQKLHRVAELYPYLAGSNYMILLLKPIYLNAIYMCVLSIGFIMLFFGYLYKKDPPQGAYIEKMVFLLLIFCTLEVFHAWSFIKALEWQSFSEFVVLGQYLSAFVLVLIAIFFALRLRFITSVKGEFYESEIIDSPAAVTRWRDSLDNLVIAHFFNRNTLLGRLFVDPNVRNSK